MSKINAVIITLIGVILVLKAAGIGLGALLDLWTIPILVLVIGIAKLKMSFGKKRR